MAPGAEQPGRTFGGHRWPDRLRDRSRARRGGVSRRAAGSVPAAEAPNGPAPVPPTSAIPVPPTGPLSARRTCPAGPVTIGMVMALDANDRIACFGSRELTFRAVSYTHLRAH